jgi:hypothetical protein
LRRSTAGLAAIAFVIFGWTSLVQAQAPGQPGNPGTVSLVPPPDAPPPHPTPPGPYPVTIEANPGLATHTIYRPSNLARFKSAKRLPIIAWGNGACSNAGLLFQTFLTEIASHGFIIIVSGPKDAPLPSFARPGGPTPTPAAAGSGSPVPPPPMTKDADMKTAIDWAVKEDERPGSPYFHRLNPNKIAVMGQSCGGLQAIVNSADPRVKTSVIWNSGTFPDNAPAFTRSISGATKASLAAVHAPIAFFNGGPHDAAYVNAVDDFGRITGVPEFLGWINVGHGGTYNHPGGGWFGDVGVAWLEWRLNGDADAAKMFLGPKCGLCVNPVWHVQKKDMD